MPPRSRLRYLTPMAMLAAARAPGVAARGVLVLALASAAPARASNEDDFFVGNRAAMTSGAVVATVSDGSAAYYNHAGLASVTRDRFDVNAAAYGLRIYSVPNFLSTTDGGRVDTSVTEVVTIPTRAVGFPCPLPLSGQGRNPAGAAGSSRHQPGARPGSVSRRRGWRRCSSR